MDIRVVGMSGEEKATLLASQEFSVADLKKAIAAQASVPIDRQKLVLGSGVLEDDKQTMRDVLEACGNVQQSVIIVTLVVMPLGHGEFAIPKLHVDSALLSVFYFILQKSQAY